MNTELIGLIANLIFLVVIVFLAIVSVLAIYILVRYGRSRSIAVTGSLVFAALFIVQSLIAFATLQNAF